MIILRSPIGAEIAGWPTGKLLVLDLEDQRIYRFEGKRLIDSGLISSGRGWHRTGKDPTKDWMRYPERLTISKKLGPKARSSIPGRYNVSTPYKFWLTPVRERIRMHGYHQVPRRPASHGCIRLEIGYAKKIYDWVEVGKTCLIIRLRFKPPPPVLAQKPAVAKREREEPPSSLIRPVPTKKR